MQKDVSPKSFSKFAKRRYLDMDSDTIIKNLIFTFIFVCIIGVVFNFFIVPRIVKYKIVFNDNQRQYSAFVAVQNRLQAINQEYESLVLDNKVFLDTIHRPIKTQDVKKLLEKFFIEVKVNKGENTQDFANKPVDEFFKVEVLAKNIRFVQNFFQELEKFPMSLKLSIPMVIEKKGKNLFVSFTLVGKSVSSKSS